MSNNSIGAIYIGYIQTFRAGKWKHKPMNDGDIVAEELWLFGYGATFLNDLEDILSESPWRCKE